MSEDDADREHEPTPKKLEEARRKGDLVRSPEVTAAAAGGGLLLAVHLFGSTALVGTGERAVALMAFPPDGGGSLIGFGLAASLSMLAPALPLFAMPLAAVVVALVAQRALVFAPDKLSPKLSRINPVANARQKFGRTGFAEFAKSLAKLVLLALISGLFIASELSRMLATQEIEAQQSISVLTSLFVRFLAAIVGAGAGIACLDWLWQRHEFLRRNRMTRQELIDELKESEGDPQMKGQRRRRAEAIASRRMLADVPKADVIIVNPTHYAVALRWRRESGRAPVCVAKGVDEMAARIREAAASAGVPIRSDAPTARALYASVEIGREILPEHYAPVAAAIRFAENMRDRARRGWR